jgi:hypothetical protein
MGQPQSVQIQTEINPIDAVASFGEAKGSSMVDTTNLNGHKTQTYENKNEELTLKTISSISSEGHDFVDNNDETVTTYEDEEEETDDFDSEEDEEFEGGYRVWPAVVFIGHRLTPYRVLLPYY